MMFFLFIAFMFVTVIVSVDMVEHVIRSFKASFSDGVATLFAISGCALVAIPGMLFFTALLYQDSF